MVDITKRPYFRRNQREEVSAVEWIGCLANASNGVHMWRNLGANRRFSRDTLVLFRGEPPELTLARYVPAPEPIRTDLLAIHRSLVTESL